MPHRLPAPRFQLRWSEAGKSTYICHYELVLPLRKKDIRRTSRKTTFVVPFNTTTRTGGPGKPCIDVDGTLFADTPYRDGRHASWDAEVLGGLPIYVIALDGTPLKLTTV